MNKTYTLILLLILCAASSFAQTHTVDLSKTKIPYLPTGYYIERVIDARLVKNSIGEVQRGLFNNRVPADFANPLEKELFQLIKRQQPKQEGQFPVILRVTQLRISELTTVTSETGTAELRLDFIYKQHDSFLKLYTATAIQKHYGMEVTHKHEENIAKALAKCLKDFEMQNFDNLLSEAQELSPAHITEASFAESENKKVNYPIHQVTAAYEKGIYMNLNDFRNNKPSITTGYEIKNRSGFDKVMMGGGDVLPLLVSEDGKASKVKDAWGFSDGTTLYINAQGTYYPLALINGEFKFLGPSMDNNAATAAVVGGVAAGMVGGIVAGSIVAANTKPTEYTLDIQSGTISMGDSYIPVGLNSKPAKLVLYRELKEEQASTVVVNCNGQLLPLSTNQLYEFDLSTQDAGTSICINGNENDCLKFMPAPGKTYYIACTNKDTTKPELKQVDEKQGEFAVKGIKFANKKAEKSK